MGANVPILARKHELPIQVPALADLIARTQLPDGRIPWSTGAKTDPWDHVEAAMGLTIGGFLGRAREAFQWLRRQQASRNRFFE